MHEDIREYYELLKEKGFSQNQIDFLNEFYEVGEFSTVWLEKWKFSTLRQVNANIGNLAGSLGGWIDCRFYNDIYEEYSNKVLFGDCDYFKISKKIDRLFLFLNERAFKIIKICEEVKSEA